MKLLRLAAWTVWFVLSTTLAYAEPVTAAIGAIAGILKAGGAAAMLIKAAFGVALQVGASLIQRATAKKQRQPGINGQLQLGGNNSFSFCVGKTATAGSLDYFGTWGQVGKVPNAYATQVITLSDLPQRGIGERIFVNGELCEIDFTATPKEYGYPVKQFHLDSNGWDYLYAKVLDGSQVAADPFLMSAFGSDPDRPWTADMIGAGSTVVLLTSLYNRQFFSQVPIGARFEPLPLPLYDPRKDSTVGGSGAQRWGQPATYQPTANQAVIIYNILRGIHDGDGNWIWGGKVPASRLPLAAWFAAMNECDVPITLKGGGTEPQFTAGLEIKVDEDEPADVIDELLKSCNGKIAETGGIYKMRVGAPGLPVMFLTDEDFVITDPQELEPFKGLEASFNGMTASYPDPAAGWEMKDAPQRLFPALEAEDDGRRRLASATFNGVSSKTQVQRLMKSMVLDGRRVRSHRGTLLPVAFGLEPLDCIAWTSTRNGYSAKRFETSSKDEMQSVNQLLAFVEVDPSDYSWTPSTDELPSAVGPLDPKWPAPIPMTGWSAAASDVKDSAGAGRRPAIDVTCAGDMTGIRAVRIQVRNAENQIVMDGESPYGEETDAPKTYKLSGAWCLPDEDFDVRGRFVPFGGQRSAWSGWLPVHTLDIRLSDKDVYLPGLVDEVLEAVEDGLDWIDGSRGLVDEAKRNVLVDIDDLVGDYQQRQVIRQEVTSTAQNVTAKAEQSLLAMAGPQSALAQSLLALEASVYDPTTGVDATAEAVVLVQAKVAGMGDELTSISEALQLLDVSVGQFSASGMFRTTVEATPAGALSRIGLSVAASDSAATSQAAAFLEAVAGGKSRFLIVADQFAVVNGSAREYPFVVENGIVRMNVAHVGRLLTGFIGWETGKMEINIEAGTIRGWD